MTRLQLQNEIIRRLKAGSYIEDPYVMVRFNNYKIFFLGPDGGKAITIPEERCTFLEALSLAGDLSNYTRRDRIAVLREVDGKMTMRYLDPRNSEVFNDPYYMLQQNDIIITQSVKSKYYKEEFSFWASWVSLLSSITLSCNSPLLGLEVLTNTKIPLLNSLHASIKGFTPSVPRYGFTVAKSASKPATGITWDTSTARNS